TQGGRGRLRDAPPFGHSPWPTSGPGREVDRDDGNARACRDVRHLLSAQADEVREGSRRREVRVLVVRGAGCAGDGRGGSGRGHLPLLGTDSLLTCARRGTWWLAGRARVRLTGDSAWGCPA